ncbi:gluzincin family metallopeptidase [Flavicella sediminum]|uniref:aminopeptidase n=1 Tax=Flavicella sediminum TaxID=2585141 RepID=UPI001AA078FE|nr:aminopeptidase [Flavicella sediminum]
MPEVDQLALQQKIVYYNNSNQVLHKIVLHNWANSFSGQKTALSKRLIENYKKSLYFADSIDRGNSNIHKLSVNFKPADYHLHNSKVDLLEIPLESPLQKNDSVVITANYSVKIPNAKFTGYGKDELGNYNLRHWYLQPAVFSNKKWQASSNLDMDNLYQQAADYDIQMFVPIGYHINAGLPYEMTYKNHLADFKFEDKKRVDVVLAITYNSSFSNYKTNDLNIATNIESDKISTQTKKVILERAVAFIENNLGKFPHNFVLLDAASYQKNKIYGINDLPNFLRPFSDVFEWETKIFKALSNKLVEETLLFDRNTDYWLSDGIQSYLMMQYVSQYYPEVKLLGKNSKRWGIKNFNFAQMDYNDKYPFVYQFSARKNIDQSLTTPAVELSNFNRKIVNKYKAGLGLRYLDAYLGGATLQNSLKAFYKENQLQPTNSGTFQQYLSERTNKDLSWFFGDYLQSKKKIDFTLKRIKKTKDSLFVTIKNTRNISAPVALYGVKNKKIQWKKWIPPIDSTKTIKIAKGNFDKISLNYEYLYPEFNLRNNWKNVRPKLFERPLQLKFIKDISDPYYNQIFYKPTFDYNYYDGFILGIDLNNKPVQKNNFEYKIVPTYSTKSETFSGKFSTVYNYFPENKKVYRVLFGVSGSRFHYDKNLNYTTFAPLVSIQFNRKNLRAVGTNNLTLKYLMIDKQVEVNTLKTDEDHYNITKLKYSYTRPDLLNDFRINTSFEFANNFNKIATDILYRKLTDKNRQWEFRWFAGVFLNNNTDSNYFSFGLSRPQDYLFEHNLFGRSEDTGIVSQQYVSAQGGFKSLFTKDTEKFANSWMTSFNTSVSIWRSLQLYNDFGAVKNTGQPIFFAHESGLRLNFVHNILEFYIPIHSNNGWEMGLNNYTSKIRFTLVLDANRIFNFVRRGFL